MTDPVALLRLTMAESGLSDAQFCRSVLAGRAVTTLYRWLNGTCPIPGATADYLARLDGITRTGDRLTVAVTLPRDRRVKLREPETGP